MSTSKTKRSTSAGPWCWQQKKILREIRERHDASNTGASALLVYFALTEIASDNQSDVFEAAYAYLAIKCGLSPRTVQNRIKDLEEDGFISVETKSLKCPSTFTLLASEEESADCNSEKSSPEPNEKAADLIDHLAAARKTKFPKSTDNLVLAAAAIAQAEGDIAGIKKMIDRQCKKWKGQRFESALTPRGLFGKKFSDYYANRDLDVCDENPQVNRSYGEKF